jgi:pyrroline-5-carboxylate reductase
MSEKTHIAIIGPGVMGRTLTSSLIQTGGFLPEALTIAGPTASRVEALCSEFGVRGTTSNTEAAASAEIVILAIKPQRLDQAAKALKGTIQPQALVLSVMAGVSMEALQQTLGAKRVIRSMPNTPAQIGMGITVWAQTAEVDEVQHALARRIFQTLGQEIFVEDENYLDMATALSGTGPAYAFLFMEAMIEAGVHMGFPRRMAEQLVVQTLKGSVLFYENNHEHPARLRDDVTSPGGTSAEALYYLEKAGFRTAISRAVWAAYQRSKELGQGRARQDPEK